MAAARIADDMVPDPDADRGCPKCGHTETDVGTISTTGGGISKMFDIQTNSFKVVSCTNCGHSELYRDDTSGTSDTVDVSVENGPSETFEWDDPTVEQAPLWIRIDDTRNIKFSLQAG